MKMMSLGMFGFSLSTLAYQELQRRTSWRHGDTSRVGARPASQFLGPAFDGISLSGVLLPEFQGDPRALDTLREMGDAGEPWPLVTGAGEILGAFVIDNIDDNASEFFEDGVARRTDFRIDIHRVDDEDLRRTGTAG